MKAINILLILSVLATLSTTAQESARLNKNILLCNSDKVEFTKAELIECNEVGVKNQDLPVVSMVISLPIGNELIEMTVQGNAFNERVIKQLEKDIKYSKLYIEKVTLADGTEVGFKTIKLKN